MKMVSSSNLRSIMACSLLVCLSVFTTVLGCGQLPSPQGTTRRFNVTGFTLPAAMAFTSQMMTVAARVPSISRSSAAATALVRNLIMQAVIDVLQHEGRNALLPDFVTAQILQQLAIQIEYTPIECNAVFTEFMPGGAAPAFVANMERNCFIIDNVVTSICVMSVAQGAMCRVAMANEVMGVPPQHLRISGSVTTTNFIMASWSMQMWQSIMSRVARSLSSGPFGSNFNAVTIIVS